MEEFSLIVYFLRNPVTGLVKIGKTKEFDHRYKNLCREEKCALEVLLTVYAEDTERQLHHYFSSTRAHHEWFKYDDRLQNLIKVTRKAGHLVYPEGAPYRDLPVDYSREILQKTKDLTAMQAKTNTLIAQLNQTRWKRDEYKKLANSANYYKTVVNKVRDQDRKVQQRKDHIFSGSLLGMSILFAIVAVISRFEQIIWLGKLTLLFWAVGYTTASWSLYTKKKKQIFEKYLLPLFLILSVMLWVVILTQYLD